MENIDDVNGITFKLSKKIIYLLADEMDGLDAEIACFLCVKALSASFIALLDMMSDSFENREKIIDIMFEAIKNAHKDLARQKIL